MKDFSDLDTAHLFCLEHLSSLPPHVRAFVQGVERRVQAKVKELEAEKRAKKRVMTVIKQ
jgi:hypothetical protein